MAEIVEQLDDENERNGDGEKLNQGSEENIEREKAYQEFLLERKKNAKKEKAISWLLCLKHYFRILLKFKKYSFSSVFEQRAVPRFLTTTPAAQFPTQAASSNEAPARSEPVMAAIAVSPAPETSNTSFAAVGMM